MSMDSDKKSAPPKKYRCLEIFNCPESVFSLSDEDRFKYVKSVIKSAGPEGFPENHFKPTSIPWYQEIAVMLFFAVLMGTSFLLFGVAILLAIFGTWMQCAVFVVVLLFLMYHPIPNNPDMFNKSRFTLWMYRYFSYRFLWCDDDFEDAQVIPAWIGAAGPHGVLPIANILSMPAINAFTQRKFRGAPANVVFNTPGLRYMTAFGACGVDGRSLERTCKEGFCIGLVPDGIAGIFKTNEKDEVVYIKNRMGLAKLALRTGIPIVPAYSIGNTDAFRAWFDSYGVMQWLSRMLRASILVCWGRFGLPIPFRANVGLLFGKAIIVEKKPADEITQEDIERVHSLLLHRMKEMFDRHKASLGQGHRNMQFV